VDCEEATQMNQSVVRVMRKSSVTDGKHWAHLLEDDVVGIDADIEKLIGLYQAKFGCTRETANAALVRRLSAFDGVGDSPLEDSCSRYSSSYSSSRSQAAAGGTLATATPAGRLLGSSF
jgi:hypothetical protein